MEARIKLYLMKLYHCHAVRVTSARVDANIVIVRFTVNETTCAASIDVDKLGVEAG